MTDEHLKKATYVVLAILILLFFTKDIPIFDKDFYQRIKTIQHPDSIIVLVNKNNKLPDDYVPNDLELLDIQYAYDDKYLRKEAKEQFEKLSKHAQKIGYRLVATSTYRDYNYQNQLFEGYIKEKGEEYALLCSAKPGHSEHQTGLAVDVAGSNDDYDEFESSLEFPWLKEHAHEYGFILRYPKGKEDITGFKYEPWHYRYVGIEVATLLYQEGITLEEYYQKYLY